MTYSWPTFSGKIFTLSEFADHIATLKWTGWKPQGIVVHNTGAPTLAQWAESGDKHAARIQNLKHYYQGLGWHAGPAAFISRSHVTEFSGFIEPGVHSTCWNKTKIGLEMVGDYSTEAFVTGDGAMVRDTTVAAAAMLLHALGLHATDTTINFHRQCTHDHHACPGKHVVSADFIAAVAGRLK